MKNLDFLGGNINFYHQDQRLLQTNFGGYITLLMSFVLGLLIFGFGQDFFKRTNPYMVKSTETPQTYPKYVLNNKNFSLAFRLEDEDGNSFMDFTKLYFEFTYNYLIKDDKGDWILSDDRLLELETCSEDMFFDGSNFAETTNLESLICPKFNNTKAGGYWDSDEVGYFYLRVNICPAGSIINGYECSSQEETDALLQKRLYIDFYYQKVIINPNDYNNGIKTLISTFYYTIDKYLMKNTYIYFKDNQLSTDYGWLVESLDIESVLGVDYTTTDFLTAELLKGSSSSNILTNCMFYFSRETDIYRREYTKAQTLVAQVGGILKMFMMIFSFIVSHYNLYYTQLSIGKFLLRNSEYKSILGGNHDSNSKGNMALSNFSNYNNIENNLSSLTNKNQNEINNFSNNICNNNISYNYKNSSSKNSNNSIKRSSIIDSYVHIKSSNNNNNISNAYNNSNYFNSKSNSIINSNIYNSTLVNNMNNNNLSKINNKYNISSKIKNTSDIDIRNSQIISDISALRLNKNVKENTDILNLHDNNFVSIVRDKNDLENFSFNNKNKLVKNSNPSNNKYHSNNDNVKINRGNSDNKNNINEDLRNKKDNNLSSLTYNNINANNNLLMDFLANINTKLSIFNQNPYYISLSKIIYEEEYSHIKNKENLSSNDINDKNVININSHYSNQVNKTENNNKMMSRISLAEVKNISLEKKGLSKAFTIKAIDELKIIRNTTCFNALKMSLYLFFSKVKLKCCLNNKSLNNYLKIENIYSNKMNFENMIFKFMMNEKLNNILFKEEQLYAIKKDILS